MLSKIFGDFAYWVTIKAESFVFLVFDVTYNQLLQL